MKPDTLYGSLDVTRHGSDTDPFTVIFVPNDAKEVSASGHTVENASALIAFLNHLGLADAAILTLTTGLQMSQRYELKLVAATSLLERYHLV